MDELKAQKGAKLDTDLDADDLKTLSEVQGTGRAVTGKPFPLDVKQQLYGSINAVFVRGTILERSPTESTESRATGALQ